MVDGLGWWDEGTDGLAASHQVGLWTESGTLLASTTVQAGTASATVGGSVAGGVFRFESIASTVITAGQSYVIACAIGTTDRPRFEFGSGVTTDHALSFTTARFGIDPFGFPLAHFASEGYFGPNVTIAAISLPGALPLMVAGLAAHGALRRGRPAMQHRGT